MISKSSHCWKSLREYCVLTIIALRSIIWLQRRRDDVLERLRGSTPRKEDQHELQIGRLKQDRVHIPRNEDTLAWAWAVLRTHAERKSVLEVGELN